MRSESDIRALRDEYQEMAESASRPESVRLSLKADVLDWVLEDGAYESIGGLNPEEP